MSKGKGTYRVLCGGSWFFAPGGLRASFRNWSTFDFHLNYYGFRLIKGLIKMNNYSITTVKIPKGKFEFQDKEMEVEEFEMTPFCITFNDWQKYVDDNPKLTMPDDSGFGKGNRPIINISWLDVQDYIQWLNKVTGEEYALPNEMQWEYACRGGTTTLYHTGDTINACQANYYNNKLPSKGTLPVGSYPPNQYGLYDMHGNVFEMCSNKYDDPFSDEED